VTGELSFVNRRKSTQAAVGNALEKWPKTSFSGEGEIYFLS
jgi:hypothetical protein